MTAAYVPARNRSIRALADSPTARKMLDKAVRKATAKHGALPAGTRRQAQACWEHLAVGSEAVVSPYLMLVFRGKRQQPISRFVEGAVALAVEQAARGIRTIGGPR